MAGQEFAFGPVQLQRKHQLMPALPDILRQKRRASNEIGERRSVGGGRLGALARDQVEFGELVAFLLLINLCGAAVELIDDVEDCLLPVLGRRVPQEQPADSQMSLGARFLPGSANRRPPGPGRG